MSESIKIKIEGLNSSKIVNHLVENGIFLKNVRVAVSGVLY